MSNQWDNNHDYHSFANVDEIRVTHLDLDLGVDFAEKRLSGLAELTLDFIDENCRHLWLDLRDLVINHVMDDRGRELHFSIDKQDDILGERLNISLEEQCKKCKSAISNITSCTGVTMVNPRANQW